MQRGRPTDDLRCPGSLQPFLGAFAHELSREDGLRMSRPGQSRDWDAQTIAPGPVDLHARSGAGDLLHRALHVNGAFEIVAHEMFGGQTPALHSWRETSVPELNGQFDEFVGEHSAADDAGVAVIEPARGDRNARAIAIAGDFIKEADGAGIIVALQIAADEV